MASDKAFKALAALHTSQKGADGKDERKVIAAGEIFEQSDIPLADLKTFLKQGACEKYVETESLETTLEQLDVPPEKPEGKPAKPDPKK